MTKVRTSPLIVLWVGFLLFLAAFAPPVAAQVVAEPAEQLRQAETDIRAIERKAQADLEDAERTLLRARLGTARQSAVAVAEQLSGELTALDARIAELGPQPAGTPEAVEVSRQRSQFAAERLALDASVKRARLLDVEAEQLATEMQRQDAEQFGNRMSKRGASPLTPTFWGHIVTSLDEDFGRICQFFADGRKQAQAQGQQSGVWFAILGLVLAILLLGPGQRSVLRLGQRVILSDTPGHRLRRSAYAFCVIVVGTLAPLLAAVLLVQGATLSHLLPPNWAPLLTMFLAATGFSAFTGAVFGALLMRREPNWRVAPIPDAVAKRLRPLTWILVGISFAGSMIDSFNKAVGASGAALAASMVLQTAASLFLIGCALFAIGRIQAAERENEAPAVSSAGVSALALLLWIVVLVASGALAIGYTEFSNFLVMMIIIATVVGAFTFLLLRLIDDVVTGVLNRSSRLGLTLVRGVGVRGSAIDQFGVLLSGALQVIVGFFALLVLLAPFGSGSGVGSVFNQIASVTEGITIGGVAVSPGAILRGVIVLVVGMALVRGFMAWLEKRYLPATDLDGSGRNSVSLIARYIGIAIAAIWALASLGIGVERVALLLSALSVGIGFGLQAITQNFISGLILLAERPIKIGDLIRVGNDEGDVKRISVRSTELELGDHSTLIIPNSELITKAVLNKTLASPLGRVQIQFSVPIETDAAQVERILLDAYAAEPAILDQPAPSVFIDSITDGRMLFNSFAHVVGPRAAYGARSNVFKMLLRRLREEDIEIGSPPQKFEFAGLAASQDEAGAPSR